MSNIALSWAFKCHVGNASAKAVLVYLADRADPVRHVSHPGRMPRAIHHRT